MLVALRDYPYGCYQAELVDYAEDAARRTATSAQFKVRGRVTVDVARYAEVAAWLVRALADVSDKTPEKFSLRYVAVPGRTAGSYSVVGTGRSIGFAEFVRPTPDDTKSVAVVAVGEEVAGAGPVTVSGRYFVLDVALADAFQQRLMDVRFRGEVQFLDATGGVVTSGGREDVGLVGRVPLPYRDPRGPAVAGSANLFVVLPTLRREQYQTTADVEVTFTIDARQLEKITGKPRVVIAPARN